MNAPSATSSGAPRRIAIALHLVSTINVQLLDGVNRYVRKHGLDWRLHLLDVETLRERDAPLPDVEAAIVTPPENAFLYQTRIPCVQVRGEDPLEGAEAGATLQIDHRQAVSMAVLHLVKRGLKRIGFAGLTGGDRHSWIRVREEAFLEACRRYGVEGQVYQADMAFATDRKWLMEDMGRWLVGIRFPAGVVAINDFRALDVQTICWRRHVRIPNEIAIVGIDNNPMICPYATPRLSSVGLNFQGIGYRAAAMLDALLQGVDQSGKVEVFRKFRLHERASSDVMRVDDPVVADALRYIRTGFSKRIGAAEIAGACRMTPQALNRRFRKELHSSLHECLQEERIRQSRTMLATTSKPLKEIANACGFQTPQYFATVFRKALGLTPGAYRKSKRTR